MDREENIGGLLLIIIWMDRNLTTDSLNKVSNRQLISLIRSILSGDELMVLK
jgi:hypothetical protein